jgi:hypothetical protein
MKCYVILILLLTSLPLFARDRQLLKCLGEEEKRFHLKKDTGPIFDLNQRLISEIIQIPNIDIAPGDLKPICNGKHESWNLLHASIMKGKNLFIIPPEVVGMQKEVTLGMIDDYIDATKEIFLGLIAQIQTKAPTPNCLKEEIPDLDAFFTDIKYLQEDVDIQSIFKGRDQKIFDHLKNYRSAFKACKSRIKTKKKPKSPSTSAPKKR